MKHILRPALFAALVFGASTTALLAQSPGPGPQGPPDGPPPGHHGPPPSPLFRALDTNHDGTISAEEIANAPAALKTLAGASGQITRDSVRPPRRDDDRRPGPDGPQGPGPQGNNYPHHGPPPPPDAQGSPSANSDGQASPPPHPPHRPDDRRHGPPPDFDHPAPQGAPSPGTSPGASPSPGPDGPHHGPPHGDRLFDFLDTNRDGVISADEIAAAADSLKKADTNGDGKIDRQDMRPPPPPPAEQE